jgi:glucans biosynthesis protein
VAVGQASFVDVRAKLFMRDGVKKLGIAPLTSMFFFGEGKQQYFDDFRPEVHDSDGVQILTGNGEWIWRPVRNPKNLQITSSLINDLGGFGLFQRDREFAHYQDTEANYHRRPSYWIEPLGQWQKGRVELVEIPTGDETNDNIVAYWVPEEIPGPGESIEFKYRLTSVGALPATHNLAYVASTRIGSPEIPGSATPAPKQHRLFVVDFQGAGIDALHESQPMAANIEASGGEVKGIRVNKLSDNGHWRVTFTLVPNGEQPVDMRMHLELRDTRISEVWNYLWSNDRVN